MFNKDEQKELLYSLFLNTYLKNYSHKISWNEYIEYQCKLMNVSNPFL